MESESKVGVAHFSVESELELFFWACWSWESAFLHVLESASGVRVIFVGILESELES